MFTLQSFQQTDVLRRNKSIVQKYDENILSLSIVTSSFLKMKMQKKEVKDDFNITKKNGLSETKKSNPPPANQEKGIDLNPKIKVSVLICCPCTLSTEVGAKYQENSPCIILS